MIITLAQLARWRPPLQMVVATNGCFDLVHIGHKRLLEAAKSLGRTLIVGVNNDDGVKALKGEGRPINPEQDRLELLNAFRHVDFVCLFHGTTATEFLKAAKPDVYVKGGDYTLATLNPDERKVLEDCGAKIVFVPPTSGKSTTAIVEKLKYQQTATQRILGALKSTIDAHGSITKENYSSAAKRIAGAIRPVRE